MSCWASVGVFSSFDSTGALSGNTFEFALIGKSAVTSAVWIWHCPISKSHCLYSLSICVVFCYAFCLCVSYLEVEQLPNHELLFSWINSSCFNSSSFAFSSFFISLSFLVRALHFFTRLLLFLRSVNFAGKYLAVSFTSLLSSISSTTEKPDSQSLHNPILTTIIQPHTARPWLCITNSQTNSTLHRGLLVHLQFKTQHDTGGINTPSRELQLLRSILKEANNPNVPTMLFVTTHPLTLEYPH